MVKRGVIMNRTHTPVAASGHDPRLMRRRVVLLVWLSGLVLAGPAAAVETFGMEDGQAERAARSRDKWVRQARDLERSRDWPGLLAWGQDWARVDAENPLAWFVQGRALGELGRYGEAIVSYRHNLRLAPGDVQARNNLGNAWRDSGRPREAMRAYRAAVEIDPDYIQAWRNLGLTFYLEKGEAGVARALRKLQAIDPELADVWRAMAVEYSVAGDERVAREAIRRWRGLSKTQRARMFGIIFDES